MVGKFSQAAHQKHGARRRTRTQLQEGGSLHEERFPLIRDGIIMSGAQLQPAQMQKLQNTAGNRAVVQAMRLDGQRLSRQSHQGTPVMQSGWFDDESEDGADSGDSWLGGAADWISDTASAAVDSVSGAAGSAWDAASEGVSQAGDMASSAADWISDTAGSAVDNVSDFAGSAWDAASEGVSQVGDMASSGAEWMWDIGTRGAQTAWDTVTEGAKTLGDMAEEAGLGKAFGLEDGLPGGLLDADSGFAGLEGMVDGEGMNEMNANTPSTYRMNVLPMAAYKITGETIADVGQELDIRQSMWGEAGHVSRTPKIDTVTYETTGKVARVDYVNDVQKEMPLWTKKEEVGKSAPKWLAEWNRFHAALDAHEEGHLNLYKSNFGTGKVSQAELAKFKGIDDLDGAIYGVEDEIAASRETAQNEYESRTKHGLPETKFNAGIPRK